MIKVANSNNLRVNIDFSSYVNWNYYFSGSTNVIKNYSVFSNPFIQFDFLLLGVLFYLYSRNYTSQRKYCNDLRSFSKVIPPCHILKSLLCYWFYILCLLICSNKMTIWMLWRPCNQQWDLGGVRW